MDNIKKTNVYEFRTERVNSSYLVYIIEKNNMYIQ